MRPRRTRLTDAMVTALKPAPQEYEVHDTLREGLRLRVGPGGGTKSWSYFYHRDGRNRRLGLGRYPKVRLTKARELAANEFGRIKGPERADPAQEVAVQRSAPTFGELADLFIESQHFATRAESTKKELRRIIDVELRPEWGHRRLSTIERQEIQGWGDRIVSEDRGYMANRCREYMQLVWHWGLGRAGLSIPPSPFYKLPKAFLGETPRDRVLTHEEIRTVFDAIGREPRITAAWWVILFLTAARDKSEALRLARVLLIEMLACGPFRQPVVAFHRGPVVVTPLPGRNHPCSSMPSESFARVAGPRSSWAAAQGVTSRDGGG